MLKRADWPRLWSAVEYKPRCRSRTKAAARGPWPLQASRSSPYRGGSVEVVAVRSDITGPFREQQRCQLGSGIARVPLLCAAAHNRSFVEANVWSSGFRAAATSPTGKAAAVSGWLLVFPLTPEASLTTSPLLCAGQCQGRIAPQE
jgi:hypothetical protein